MPEDWIKLAMGLALGVSIAGLGLWMLALEARERAATVETRGMIVATAARTEPDPDRAGWNRTVYAPVIEFPLPQTASLAGGYGRFNGRFEPYRASEGKAVVVRYQPASPWQTARVVEPLEDLGSLGAIGLGAAALAATALEARKVRAARRGLPCGA